MEKMFYSIEEAAAKLGKSVDEVKQLASRGQLQEFRDRDKLMFKKEQVDLLAGGDDDMIPLAGDSGELALSSSGTGLKLEPAGGGKDPKESSAISFFEADATDDADANAVTRVASAQGISDPGKSGSGSGGLLDLTKEADDTSLGAGLMEDVYGSETVAQQTAAEVPAAGGEGAALFESPGAGMETEAAVAPVMAIAEVYDGKGSFLVGAAALGIALAAGIAAFILIMGMTSTAGGGMLASVADMFWLGGAVAILFLFIGVVGFFVKKN
jgi:hypothetical protein